nr:carboxypeptidase-like regulatory domain-containing protein [Segetibacter sp.]
MRSLRDTLTRTKNAVFLVLLLFAMQSISAQTRTVSGKVSSDKNEPLSGVTVTIKNSNRATSTNANGTFSITAERNAVLVFSMVGFEGKELPANEPTVNVIMQTATKAMDEVVVVGYGTVKKSDVTGAVVSLKASELTSGANVNVQQMLQGRAAGVQ